MTVICNELDKRIKDINAIQTILRYDVNCIGCKGYFFDEFIQTKDLSKCRYGELENIITDNGDLCFKEKPKNGNTFFYRFFIPEADLKPVEKKYRPFTINEWKEVIKDNYHWITMRVKETNQEFSLMYTGFITTTKGSYISLGSHEFDFKYLVENYEIFVNNQWQPFGVLVEDDE